MKSYLKQSIKRLRTRILGDRPPERLKPIHLGNSFYWLRYTLKTEYNHYLAKQRPNSLTRLLKNLKPSLRNPVFIVGAPRSGTTFLGECMAQLPELSYHFEPVVTKAAARYVYDGTWSTIKAEKFYKNVYAWLMRIHLDGDLRFAEKTPQLCFVLPFLAKIFPDAKFVHIIRDGRDAALSLAQKPWHRNDHRNSTIRDPDGYLCGPWARFWVESNRVEEFETTDDFHRCIWLWRCHVESVLSAASSLPSQSYYEINYEKLVKEPKAEAEGLLDFMKIHAPSSRQILKDVIAQGAKADSVGRWQRELSEDQYNKALQEAVSLLQELGYWQPVERDFRKLFS